MHCQTIPVGFGTNPAFAYFLGAELAGKFSLSTHCAGAGLGFLCLFLPSEASDRPCLYCQIKGEALSRMTNSHPFGVGVADAEETTHDADNSGSDEAMIEVKFIPDDSRYGCICKGQATTL